MKEKKQMAAERARKAEEKAKKQKKRLKPLQLRQPGVLRERMKCLHDQLNKLSLPKSHLNLTLIHVTEHTKKTCRQEEGMTGFNVCVGYGPMRSVLKSVLMIVMEIQDCVLIVLKSLLDSLCHYNVLCSNVLPFLHGVPNGVQKHVEACIILYT